MCQHLPIQGKCLMKIKAICWTLYCKCGWLRISLKNIWGKKCVKLSKEILVYLGKYISLQSPGQSIKVNFVYISSSVIQTDRSA